MRDEDLQDYLEGRTLADDKARFQPFTEDDPLWNIVGIIDGDEPWVSGDKYRALADAYMKQQ